MKFKSLVAISAASLLATSMSFAAGNAATAAAPSDMSGSDDPMSVATNDANPAGLNSTGTTANALSADNMLASNGTSSANAGANPLDSSNSNDDMSADTATGDDDY